MGWRKNEATAASRQCLLTITEGGYPVSPGIDPVADGAVFVIGVNSPEASLATGTVTNVRRPLVVADDTVESVDTGADTVTMTAHSYETGDGPFDSNEVTGPVAIGGDIYSIKVDANTVAWATSPANAYANTRIALAGTETGAVISDNASTERGIWGHFVYQAPQAELNHDFKHTHVFVDGLVTKPAAEGGGTYSCLRMNGSGAHTEVEMLAATDDVWAVDGEGGFDMRALVIMIARTMFGRLIISGTTHTFRNLDDTANSHHGTVTAAGRDPVTIDNAP
jgi:hypothetical protein